jgi:hypothetical protein
MYSVATVQISDDFSLKLTKLFSHLKRFLFLVKVAILHGGYGYWTQFQVDHPDKVWVSSEKFQRLPTDFCCFCL